MLLGVTRKMIFVYRCTQNEEKETLGVTGKNEISLQVYPK